MYFSLKDLVVVIQIVSQLALTQNLHIKCITKAYDNEIPPAGCGSKSFTVTGFRKFEFGSTVAIIFV